jgi:GT2 family glycosyltransferase
MVTAVVVNWNGGDVVVDCLRSLLEFPPSVGLDIVLVDNASSDGSVDRIRAELPGVRIIANSRNLGLPAANNQGIKASTSPYVLISNPDVIYQAGSVDALVDLLDRRAGASFAFAQLRDPDGRVQTAAGDLPTLREALLGRVLTERLRRRRSPRTGTGDDDPRRGFWWYGWEHDSEQRIGHGIEACYLVRRSAIDDFGLQDESFVLDWEGIEWSRRAAEAGWEIWFCPRAQVIHAGGVSIRQVPFRWVVSSHRGMYRYFRHEVRPVGRPLAAAAIGLRAGAKLAAAAVDPRLYDRAH